MPELNPSEPHPETHLAGRALDLYRIARALNAAEDLQGTLQALLKSTAEEMGLHACSLRLVGPRRHTLRLVSAYGLSDTYLNKGPIDIDRSPIDQEALEGKVVIIDEVADDPRWLYRDHARTEGIHSVLVVPLRVEERIAGVLRAYSARPYRFTREEVSYLTAVADLGALCIETAKIHEALFNIAKVLNSANKLTDVLNGVVKSTAEEMMLKACSIQLVEAGGRLATQASYGLSDEFLAMGDIDVSRTLLAARAFKGETVMVSDVLNESNVKFREAFSAEGIRAVLVVPLRLRNQIIGVMRVYSAAPQRFTQKEINFLQSVANLAALAIENAKLYEKLSERYEGLKGDLSEWYNFLSLG